VFLLYTQGSSKSSIDFADS